MIQRNLFSTAFSENWGRQMRFIVGPRQCGKTTIAKEKLNKEDSSSLYFLWDLRSIRQQYRNNELFFVDSAIDPKKNYWVCFDEMHKIPRWKNILKASFDQTGDQFRFIVTGSARMDLMRHSGDSLAGRYFLFHLFPLTISEVEQSPCLITEQPITSDLFIERCLSQTPARTAAVEQLLSHGGFPEPFLSGSDAFYRKWTSEYSDTVIKEDIGTLTRIIEREHLHDLYSLLPDSVGSPLSQFSLANHLQISPVTVKNHLRRLEDFYLTFSIRPYSKNVKRSLLKTRKYYLYDWSRIKEAGPRFENFLACEIFSRTMLWSDASGEKFELFYLRTKEKLESDFLVTKNSKPWIIIEAKLSDQPIEKHHLDSSKALGGIPVLQICNQNGILRRETMNAFRMSINYLTA